MATVPRRLRFRVLERDGFRCRYCGKGAAQGALLEVDHVHPRSHGGRDSHENLVTACSSCNGGKSDLLLMPDPVARAEFEAESAFLARRRSARVLCAWLVSVFGVQELGGVTPLELSEAARAEPPDLLSAIRETLAWATRERMGPRVPATWYFLDALSVRRLPTTPGA